MAQLYKKEVYEVEDEERNLVLVEQITAEYEKQEFVMIYLQAMLQVCEGRQYDREQELLYRIAQKQLRLAGSPQPNVVYLLKKDKEELAKEMGIGEKTIANMISSFKKRGILKPVSRGVYKLNPYLITRGRPQDIKKIQLEYGDGSITSKIIYDAKEENEVRKYLETDSWEQ